MEERKWSKKHIDELFVAISMIENIKEVESFFRDMLTVKEIIDLAERWQIAKKVQEGLSYREISKVLGVSTTTVTRVAHWLKNGEGGFDIVMDKMKEKSNQKEGRKNDTSIEKDT